MRFCLGTKTAYFPLMYLLPLKRWCRFVNIIHTPSSVIWNVIAFDMPFRVSKPIPILGFGYYGCRHSLWFIWNPKLIFPKPPHTVVRNNKNNQTKLKTKPSFHKTSKKDIPFGFLFFHYIPFRYIYNVCEKYVIILTHLTYFFLPLTLIFSFRFFTCFFTLTLRFSALASLTAFFLAFLLSGDSSLGRAEFLNLPDASSSESSSSSSSLPSLLSDSPPLSSLPSSFCFWPSKSGFTWTCKSAFKPATFLYTNSSPSPVCAFFISRSKWTT